MKSRTKIIAVATAACAGVAMVSVGFASWVISQNASVTENATIKVDTVTDERLTLDVSVPTGEKVVYGWEGTGPDWLTNTDVNTEQDLTLALTIKVTKGTVSSAGITVTISAPAIYAADDTDKSNDLYAQAVTNGCIASLDDAEHVTAEIGETAVANTATAGSGVAKFVISAGSFTTDNEYAVTLNVTFSWGSHFDYKNPMAYYTENSNIDTYGDDAVEYLGYVAALGESAQYNIKVEGVGQAS